MHSSTFYLLFREVIKDFQEFQEGVCGWRLSSSKEMQLNPESSFDIWNFNGKAVYTQACKVMEFTDVVIESSSKQIGMLLA